VQDFRGAMTGSVDTNGISRMSLPNLSVFVPDIALLTDSHREQREFIQPIKEG